jgi:hypothetical protein
MGFHNWFEFQGDGGAAMWVEGLDRNTPGITCHGGKRCVGMELTDITKSRRNQFSLSHLEQNPLLGNELFVSVWLYVPADWKLHLPPPSWNWYEIANPIITGGGTVPPTLPCNQIHINQPDGSKDVFNLAFQTGTGSSKVTLKEIPNYSFHGGRWFNLQYYVFRDPTNGVLKVWIDGTLLLDAGNLWTKDPSITEWYTTIAKIYYEDTDTFSPYTLWVDDLSIYNTIPQTSSSASTSTTNPSTTAPTSSSTTQMSSSRTSSTSTSSSTTIKSTITTTSNSTSYLVVKRRR